MVSSSLILLMASSSILRSDSFSPPNWAPSAENDFSSGSIGFSLADMGSDGVSVGLALRGRKPNRLMAAILWCADPPGRCDAESPCAYLSGLMNRVGRRELIGPPRRQN